MAGTKTRADSSKRARRAARRQELLDAAVTAIREHGSSASMEQLAAAGGVTKPILYRHFGDREGLVAAIGAQFGAELTSQITSSLTSGTTPQDLLVSTIDSYVAFIERDPDLYQFLVQFAATRPVGAEVVLGLMDSISRQVAVVIGEQLRNAGLDSGAAEPWAFGIVGMVHHAGNWWVSNQTMPRARLVQYLSDLLWNGLGIED